MDSLNNVISTIVVYTTSGKTVSFSSSTTQKDLIGKAVIAKLEDIIVNTMVNYIENCFVLDFNLNNVLKEKWPTNIYIYFKHHPISIEIIPQDRNLFADRPVLNNRLYSRGSPIEFKNDTKQGAYDKYVLDLSQDVYLEEDTSKQCMKYPNATYKNYNECDTAFIRRTLDKYFGPDFVPVWATGDLSNVTTSHFIDWNYDYGLLFDGSKMSDCPLPCTTTTVNTVFIARSQVNVSTR